MNAQEMLFNAVVKSLGLNPQQVIEQMQGLAATAQNLNDRMLDIQNKQLVILNVLAKMSPEAFSAALLPEPSKEETIQ